MGAVAHSAVVADAHVAAVYVPAGPAGARGGDDEIGGLPLDGAVAGREPHQIPSYG